MMYILDKISKKLEEISKTTFLEESLKERYDLQEWIDDNPKVLWSALGEEILIIQKEFSDFDKTKERLDLLAIDKNGNLVLIENKLDDSGRDVTWQALKYVSYCSKINKEEIINIYQEYLDKKYPNQNKNAITELCEFFKREFEEFEDISLNLGFNQRIILIAKEFRPEVTSTVLWLRAKNIDVQCIKFVPYKLDDSKIIIDVDKIIPIPEAEDYMIRLSQKGIEETTRSSNMNKKKEIYSEYWDKLLDSCKKEKLDLFQNRTTSKDSWISVGSAVRYKFAISNSSVRVELYIYGKEKQDNKKIFDLLIQDKVDIENELGLKLSWERSDDYIASRIFITNDEIFKLDNKDSWDKAIEWQIEIMKKFEETFKKRISVIINKL
ncbi:DUF4268 domain-containing protein [Avibacterium paragallinarum]|uniref:DUF4268 domain-containing protein n=1 Tax=Avibacterium paragallinarum TaxID=728 RepID=UPI00397D5E50